MMRNKYTEEFEIFVKENISKYTKEDFILLLEKKFKLKISKNALKSYIRKHNIKDRYIDFKKNMVRSTPKHPIGAERMTKDGILIKVAQPNVWKRKARVMYEKYHNCKLNANDYILFLNQDRNDFSKENLIKSSIDFLFSIYISSSFSNLFSASSLVILPEYFSLNKFNTELNK